MAGTPSSQGDGPRKRYSVLDAWKEPRVILIGLFVMLIAFAEGSAVDWIGLGLIDGYGTAATVGTLGLATFLTAMTMTRWFGTPLLDRFGRVPVLAALSLVLTAGQPCSSLPPTQRWLLSVRSFGAPAPPWVSRSA